jgi:hypothetical protein
MTTTGQQTMTTKQHHLLSRLAISVVRVKDFGSKGEVLIYLIENHIILSHSPFIDENYTEHLNYFGLFFTLQCLINVVIVVHFCAEQIKYSVY